MPKKQSGVALACIILWAELETHVILRNAGQKGRLFKLLAGGEVAVIALEIAGAVGGLWAHSASASTLNIPLVPASHVEKISTFYQCSGSRDLRDRLAKPSVPVTYFNAGAVSLAVLQVDGQTLVFSNVISGSGARYTANRFEWWSKGETAFFSEVGSDPAAQLTCKATQNVIPHKAR